MERATASCPSARGGGSRDRSTARNSSSCRRPRTCPSSRSPTGWSTRSSASMPEATLPEKRAVRRAFERAAESYERGAALQREVGARLLAHLDPIRVSPARLLDLGSGPGPFFEALARRFAGAEIVAID